MMTQDGGMIAQLQGNHEGGWSSTTKSGGMWKTAKLIALLEELLTALKDFLLRFERLFGLLRVGFGLANGTHFLFERL